MLVGYRPQGLIATQIFPVVPVRKQSNAYLKIDRGNWFRVQDGLTLRAPGTRENKVGFTVSSATYYVRNYALGTSLAWEDIDNADDPLNLRNLHNQLLVDQLMLDFEDRVARTVNSASNVGSSVTLSGADQWSDFANSDPLTNFETAAEAIRSTTGFNPNTIVMGQKVWLKLRRHPQILSALFPTGQGQFASLQQAAELFGVDRVLVGAAIKNTAAEGQSDSFSDVWGKHCLVAYVAPQPGIMVPTYGASFRWTGPTIGAFGPDNLAVEVKNNTDLKAEEQRAFYYQSEEIVAPELAYLILNAVA